MALAPPSLAPPPGAAGSMAADPTAGAAGDADADADDTVVVTICRNADGTYMVYPGDEPDAGDAGDTDDGDMGPAAGMGPAGAAPALGAGVAGGNGATPQGVPADSIGAALKEALTIMQSDASDAGGPDADSQFNAGFGGDKTPTLSSAPIRR